MHVILICSKHNLASGPVWHIFIVQQNISTPWHRQHPITATWTTRVVSDNLLICCLVLMHFVLMFVCSNFTFQIVFGKEWGYDHYLPSNHRWNVELCLFLNNIFTGYSLPKGDSNLGPKETFINDVTQLGGRGSSISWQTVTNEGEGGIIQRDVTSTCTYFFV